MINTERREIALSPLRFMGDLSRRNPISSPISPLPPGFRFYPNDQQLFTYYLSLKNNRNPSSSGKNPIYGLDVIREFDLYSYDPCDLPEVYSFSFGHGGSKKHWYFFTVKMMGNGGEDSKRKANGGFWKSKGLVRSVACGKEGVVVGTRRSFAFYRSSSSRSSSRTNWVLVEYCLVDHQKDSYVLCRVFLKAGRVSKIVEHKPNSYAIESNPDKPKMCTDARFKKQDAPSTSGVIEVVEHEDARDDKSNNIEKRLLKVPRALDDAVLTPSVPGSGFPSSTDMPQSGQQVKFTDGGVISDGADKPLTSYLTMDGDFLELNDLDCPLLGFDSAG